MSKYSGGDVDSIEAEKFKSKRKQKFFRAKTHLKLHGKIEKDENERILFLGEGSAEKMGRSPLFDATTLAQKFSQSLNFLSPGGVEEPAVKRFFLCPFWMDILQSIVVSVMLVFAPALKCQMS